MGSTLAVPLIQGAGSLLSGAAGAGASLATNKSNEKIAAAQIAAQQQSQENQNNWQAAENDKDRDWQSEEWLKQFFAQNEEWLKRFNLENEYNTPSAQVARLKAAGINPAALSGSGGLASAGSAADPSGISGTQMPPSHSVTPLGIQNPQVAMSSSAQMFSSVAQMVDAVSTAGRLGMDMSRQKRELPVLLDNIMADTANKQQQTAYNEMKQQLINAHVPNYIMTKINEMQANIGLLISKKDLTEADKQFQQAMTWLTNTKDKALRSVLPNIQSYFTNLFEVQKSEVHRNEGAAAAGYASAQQSTENALTTAALRDGLVRGQDLANTISEANAVIQKNEAKLSESTFISRLDALCEAYAREGLITQFELEKYKGLVKDNNWKGIKNFFEVLESGTRSAKNVVNTMSVSHFLLGSGN